MSMEEFNNNNLKFLLQRYWLQNAEEDCLKNIKDDILNLNKINMFTMAAVTSSHKALKSASNNMEMLLPFNKCSLMKYCDKKYDSNSVSICFEMLAKRKGRLDQDTYGLILESKGSE